MDVTIDLLHVVEQAHSLERILEAATRVVAERLRVDGCFVFLLDTRGDLVRAAAGGLLPRTLRAATEVESLAAQAFAEKRAAAEHGETTSLLASPMLLRDRVVGALVLQSGVRRDWSAEDIGTLATICAQLVGIVENARIIEALDRGEQPEPATAPRSPSTEAPGGERIHRGVGASPGIAIGPAVFRRRNAGARSARAPSTRSSATSSPVPRTACG